MAKIIDENGVERHAMTRTQLEALYKALENFIADCTVSEYNGSRPSFERIKTIIHQRMREADE